MLKKLGFYELQGGFSQRAIMHTIVDLCEDSPTHTNQSVPRDTFPQQNILDTSLRRSLLEACTFLSVACIETCVALTSRAWLQLSRDEELWKRKWLEEQQPFVTPSSGSFRAAFLDLRLGSCWHCRLYINHFGVQCPSLQRLLCQACAQLSSCQVLSFATIAQQFSVQLSTFDLLHVPSFIVDNEPATYLCLASSRLRPYYERRRKLVLPLIRNAVTKTILRKLHSFDFAKMFENTTTELQALCAFCGRNEQTERLDESVNALLKQLKIRR